MGELYTLVGDYGAARVAYETAAAHAPGARLRIEFRLGDLHQRLGNWGWPAVISPRPWSGRPRTPQLTLKTQAPSLALPGAGRLEPRRGTAGRSTGPCALAVRPGRGHYVGGCAGPVAQAATS
ncbi:MAG: hypothetical protein R2854_28610 [Caldilineaceae bacterium]